MWPFRRRAEAAPAAGPQPVPAPVIRRDWVGLPPIQRLIGAHPLTAPSDRFSDDLATHHDPSVSSDSMGHQVSAEAPAGLVLALARPTTRSDGPAMIPRPRVQRRETGAVAESGEWDGDAAAPETTRPTPLPASAPAVAARELPVVEQEAPLQRLTALPADAEPIPAPPRARATTTPFTISRQSDDPAELSGLPTPRLSLGQSRRLGLGAPIKQVSDRTAQRTAVEPVRDHSSETAASVPPSHRPLPGLPPTERESLALTQQEGVPVDLAQADRMPMNLAPSANQTTPSVQRAHTRQDAGEEPRLDLPLPRRRAVQGPFIEQPASTADEPIPAAQGERALPVQTKLAEISAPVRESSTTSHSTASPPPMETDVPASVWPEREQAPAAVERPTALVPGAPIPTLPLARQPSVRGWTAPATPGWATAATAPVVGARPLAAIASLQRFAPALAPPEAAPGLPLAQSPREALPPTANEKTETGYPDAFETATRSTSDVMPPAAALADDWARSIPQPAAASTPATSLPLAPARGLTIQRAAGGSSAVADDEPEAEAAPMLQGVWYDAPAPGTSSGVSTASPASAGPAIGAAPSPGQAAAETDMDELAGRLYDRIRTRLKSELLVDRERAGLLTDLR
jgi:hypothetical protein